MSQVAIPLDPCQWQRRRRSSEEVQGTESVAWQRGPQTVVSFLRILLLVSASAGILWWPPTCHWDSGLPDGSAHSCRYKLYSITDFWKQRWRDLVLRRTPAQVKCGYSTLFSSFSSFLHVLFASEKASSCTPEDHWNLETGSERAADILMYVLATSIPREPSASIQWVYLSLFSVSNWRAFTRNETSQYHSVACKV